MPPPANSKITKAFAKRQVLAQWEHDRPPLQGVELDEWAETMAAELGEHYTPKFVKQCLWESCADFSVAMAAAMRPEAQRQADLLGATQMEAIETLRKGLRATKKRPLVVNGVVEMVEVEDHPTRLVAADKILKIHGGYAPERVESFNANVSITANWADLIEESKVLDREIRRIETQRKRVEAAQSRGQLSAQGAIGAEGPVLLVDAVYEDGGQPAEGRGKPVQAVPAAELHPPSA